MSRLIIEGDSSDLEDVVDDISTMRQVRLARGDGIGDLGMKKEWLEAQIEPDPDPLMPYPDPEPLTDVDKLRNRVNGIELTYDRRLDEMKAHYEDLLRAANGADLNKLRYDLTGLEKTFNSMGPISINQVVQIAKDQVQVAIDSYPSDIAEFIPRMREWATKLQKDLEERLKKVERDYENEWKVEQTLHGNPSIRSILEQIEGLNTRYNDLIANTRFVDDGALNIISQQVNDVSRAEREDRKRIESLETGSAHGGATDDMFAKDRKRIKELEVLVEQDHKLLFAGDLGLGIRVENIETAIGGTDNEYDINRRLNELRDREKKLESVVTDLEEIHQGHGHAWEPKEARTRIDALEKLDEEKAHRITTVEERIKTINDLIRPLERIRATGSHFAMVEEDDLPALVAFARDWKGGKLKAEVDKQWEEINGLIRGLQTTDRTIHTLVGQINRLEENTGPEIAGTDEEVKSLSERIETHLKDHEGRIINLEEQVKDKLTEPLLPSEIEAILGRFGTIEEKTLYIFNELHPNDPGRAGGVIQDLYSLQRTDYKNLSKRIDACMKEINGHGHSEFENLEEKIKATNLRINDHTHAEITQFEDQISALKTTEEALEKGLDETNEAIGDGLTELQNQFDDQIKEIEKIHSELVKKMEDPNLS